MSWVFETQVTVTMMMSLRVGGVAVVVQGVLHAGLSAWLAADGQQPSRPVPLFEDTYAAQAFYVLPLLLVGWVLSAHLASRVVRRPFAAVAGRIGVALAVPPVVCWLIPDLVVYGLFGFAALGPLLRIAAPLTFALTLAALCVALRGRRMVWGVLVVLLNQGLVVAPFVR